MLFELMQKNKKTSEEKYLQYWLSGLTKKTLVNLGGTISDLPDFLNNLNDQLITVLNNINRQDDIDKAWLLMMSGTAALSIRGADKSKVGKSLKKYCLGQCWHY